MFGTSRTQKRESASARWRRRSLKKAQDDRTQAFKAWRAARAFTSRHIAYEINNLINDIINGLRFHIHRLENVVTQVDLPVRKISTELLSTIGTYGSKTTSTAGKIGKREKNQCTQTDGRQSYLGETGIRHRHGVFRHRKMTKGLALLSVAFLIAPAAAMDNAIVPLQTYPPGQSYSTTPYVFQPNRISDFTAGAADGFIPLILLLLGYLATMAKSVLGPVMGVSSVLWFIMRNDAAVRPDLSWMVFGVWSVVTLSYLSYQCTRVAHHKLYILLALAFSGVCLCIVALVQKSSIQGGLVTAIPPCTSFAAYAVAFIFPSRRQNFHINNVV